MKKIMFNDRFGLTIAVLEGEKTQTRRIVPQSVIEKYSMMEDFTIIDDARYDVGEVVAVAQSYKDCGYSEIALDRSPKDFRIVRGTLRQSKGWKNKMFVRADACKHQIRITDVRVERLHGISDEDCLAEGIYPYYYGDEKEKRFYDIPPNGYSFDGMDCHYPTPREAFANLIDKVSGKGTWDSNPYVWVYDFELVK